MVRDFFKWEEENVEKIMLVFSDSVGVIDAKLRVYRKYKDDIDANGIFLLHGYENYDEVAKSVVFKKVSGFRNLVRDLIDIFSSESLESIVSTAVEISIHIEPITRLCYGAVIEYGGIKVGSVNSGAYNCYTSFTVVGIKKKIAKETLMETANSIGSTICRDVLKHIENAIQSQLSQKLKTIDISNETYEIMQQRFRFVVIDIFRYIPDLIIRLIENLINLFLTVFNPVDVNSERWRSAVAREIYVKLMQRKQTITNDISDEIKKMCWKTKQDLQFIDRKLTEFTKNVFPKDKKQRKYIFIFAC